MKTITFATITCITFFSSQCNSQQSLPAKKNADTGYTYKQASPDGIGKFYFGREIAHVMGAAGAAWLERDERQKEENTALAIEKMNLKPNETVADIGAGSGYYTFRLAQKVPHGKVYAVDIQDEMINYLNKRKKDLNNTNVEVIKGTISSANLPENSVDLAIMVDVYHELEFPHEMLQSLRKSLKENGKILLLEYRGEDPSVPIKALHKTSVDQLNKEFSANGFKLSYRGEFLPIQHFLVYQKNSFKAR